jgi:nucleoside-diphosphate-sugar epimerase
MKILVTGATGFIGTEIIAELIKKDFETFGVASLKSSGKTFNTSDKSKIFFSDISIFDTLSELKKIGNVDVVIHSAGLAHQFGDTKKEAFESVNVVGTKNVARLAIDLGAKHFILIGSTAVYGIKPAIRTSNSSTEKFVSIDEETTNLMQYQHAFDASARVIKVADEMLDTILSLRR